ncbi:MAG: hypothetical protein ACREF0_16510 [Acetobacteraceae bacterium]
MLDPLTFLAIAVPVAGAVAWLDRRFGRLAAPVVRMDVRLGHVEDGMQALGRDFSVLRDNHIAHLSADIGRLSADVARLSVAQRDTRDSIRQLAARDAFIEQQLAELARPR